MKFYLIIIYTLSLTACFGQKYSYKKKQTTQKGAMYFYWGYNRSIYAKSNIKFTGPGYDFTVKKALAHDNPSRNFKTYINPATISVPQFNIRMGFYIKPKIDISFGYDHMKYVMTNNQSASISGSIADSVNTFLNGDFYNQNVILTPAIIHYENSNGLNYISVQANHTSYFYRSKNRKIYLQKRLGVGLGGVITQTDFKWNNQSFNTDLKITGFGGSVHTGIRADFFNRFFVQSNWSVGYLNLPNLETIKNTSHRAKQQFIYADWQLLAGFFFYTRLKDGCSSCPDW